MSNFEGMYAADIKKRIERSETTLRNSIRLRRNILRFYGSLLMQFHKRHQ